MFGYYAGGGRLERTADVPDTVAFEGAMGSIVVDGKPITFRGLAPLVRVIHSRSDSTIPIFDFKRTRVEFALSREF